MKRLCPCCSRVRSFYRVVVTERESSLIYCDYCKVVVYEPPEEHTKRVKQAITSSTQEYDHQWGDE